MKDIFLKDQEIQEIFKSHIRVESKVMSIETLFANKRRQQNTVYNPYYQRNYVWDDDKATYFIESILLGTEIPPLVFFNSGAQIEVIDGRQRFETIKRFIDGNLELKKNGLAILKDYCKKKFNDLNIEIMELFWDTKIRIIEFAVVNEPKLDERKEDLIKKEIFRRYNSGITPLKHAEIAKAIYITDDTTSYFKNQFKANPLEYQSLLELFFSDRELENSKKSLILEKAMEKIRTFLVLHLVPINYYSTSKSRKEIIGRLFENLSNSTTNSEELYKNFKYKIDLLINLKVLFNNSKVSTNRLIYECLVWAFSVLENEKINLVQFEDENLQKKLVNYISKNINKFGTENSHFYTEFNERYSCTAHFFEKQLNLDLDLYLTNKGRFKLDSMPERITDSDTLSKLEFLRLNKPDASTKRLRIYVAK